MREKTNEILVPYEIVMNKIYHIRGMKVMIDKDLAELLKRFPDEDFMFQLTGDECHYVFTEQGVAMLSGIQISNFIYLIFFSILLPLHLHPYLC
jgi:hypothetical protein